MFAKGRRKPIKLRQKLGPNEPLINMLNITMEELDECIASTLSYAAMVGEGQPDPTAIIKALADACSTERGTKAVIMMAAFGILASNAVETLRSNKATKEETATDLH